MRALDSAGERGDEFRLDVAEVYMYGGAVDKIFINDVEVSIGLIAFTIWMIVYYTPILYRAVRTGKIPGRGEVYERGVTRKYFILFIIYVLSIAFMSFATIIFVTETISRRSV